MIFKNVSLATLLAATVLGSYAPCAYGMEEEKQEEGNHSPRKILTDDEINNSKILAKSSSSSDEKTPVLSTAQRMKAELLELQQRMANLQVALAQEAEEEEAQTRQHFAAALEAQRAELARQDEALKQQRAAAAAQIAAFDRARLEAEEAAQRQAVALEKAKIEDQQRKVAEIAAAAEQGRLLEQQRAAETARRKELKIAQDISALEEYKSEQWKRKIQHRNEKTYNKEHYGISERNRLVAQKVAWTEAYPQYAHIVPVLIARAAIPQNDVDRHLAAVLLAFPTDHPCQAKLEAYIRNNTQ